MTDKIDWDGPLEAYRPDGVVVGATRMKAREVDNDVVVIFDGESGDRVFHRDGSHWGGTEWRIRNRRPTEAPSPELVARIKAHFRAVAEKYPTSKEPFAVKARALLAELEPTDPDLIEAREIAAQDASDKQMANAYRAGKNDDWKPVRIALAAIKRGREREREGK